MTLTVLPAVADEAGAVVDLLVAQLAEHDIDTPRAGVERAVAGALADPRRAQLFVARRDGLLVGVAYLSFVWTLEHGGHSSWLEELYVVPAERQRGVGGRMLDAIVAFARAAGCAAVDLEVESAHARAENLYARAGFRRHTRARWVKLL